MIISYSGWATTERSSDRFVILGRFVFVSSSEDVTFQKDGISLPDTGAEPGKFADEQTANAARGRRWGAS